MEAAAGWLAAEQAVGLAAGFAAGFAAALLLALLLAWLLRWTWGIGIRRAMLLEPRLRVSRILLTLG